MGATTAGAGEEARVLVKKTSVAVPPQVVWNAWTTSQGLARFFTPNSTVELRVGGKYELFMKMDMPEGKRGSEGCVILSYVPQELFTFEWNCPPSIPSLRDINAKTHVVLELTDAGSAGTRLKLTHLGWGTGEDWDECYAYFDRAWSNVMASLKKELEGADPKPDPAKRSAAEARTWTDEAVTVTATIAPIKRQDFEVVIDARVETVWDALATTDGVRKFGYPKSVVVLKPWGAYSIWPGSSNKVLSYLPKEMLSVTGSAPPKFPTVQKGGTWGVYRLSEAGGNKTRLRLTSVGWHEQSGSEWNEAFDYFLKANATYLNGLRTKLESVQDKSGK